MRSNLATAIPTICLIPSMLTASQASLCPQNGTCHSGSLANSVHFGAEQGYLHPGPVSSQRLPISHIPSTVNSPKPACASKVHDHIFFLDPSVAENPPIHLHIITHRSHTKPHSDMSHRNTVIIPNRFTVVWVLNPFYPSFWSRMKEPCTFLIMIVTVRVLTTHILVSTLKVKIIWR